MEKDAEVEVEAKPKKKKPKKRVPPFMRQAVIVTLARIEQLESAMASLEYIQRVLHDRYSRGEMPPGYTQIRGQIYEQLTYSHRQLMMWGIVGDARAKKEARKIAFEKMLKANWDLRQYLELNYGCVHGGFSEKDELEFRQELLRAKAAGDMADQLAGKDIDNMTLQELDKLLEEEYARKKEAGEKDED